MLFTMLQLVPIAAMSLCTAGAPVPATSSIESAPLVAAVAAAPERMKELSCLAAFSKNYCDGFMYPGHSSSVGCPFGTVEDCKTLDVTGATLYLPMFRNRDTCTGGDKCDEIPEKDGYLKVAVNYSIRLNKPCPYRGCISGEGEYRANDGNTYVGTYMGTIGVGTHRKFECLDARECYCENCVDVEFAPNYSAWRIGFEGSFHGKNADGLGEELCISLSGDWYVEGNDSGPFDLTGNFKIHGTADGVLRTFCH